MVRVTDEVKEAVLAGLQRNKEKLVKDTVLSKE